MRIIELKELKTNTAFLLTLTGILIIPGLNRLETVLNLVVLLISDLLGFPFFLTGLTIHYIFQGFIIFGLIYLIIKTLRNNHKDENYSLIKLQHKHFKIILFVFLILLIVSISLNYLTKDLYSKSIQAYAEKTSLLSRIETVNMELADSIISVGKGMLLLVLFITVYLKENKNSTNTVM